MRPSRKRIPLLAPATGATFTAPRPVGSRGYLTVAEKSSLARLGARIIAGLSCGVGHRPPSERDVAGFPCATDRLDAVEAMAKYLRLHGWKVSR